MSEQTQQHTPKDAALGLPWKLEVLGDQLRVTKSDFETDNDDIAGLGDCRKEANKAQGDFIVRACNAHDELVAALDQAVTSMQDSGYSNRHLAVRAARAAIAKATGAA